ncbi:MAG TPA: cbb3-type cytochrome oxidase assembly protein CcoS [Kiloniellaceae bacterium]|nr:cbb3-type cytochrome oxidase assembly protein CcoS [Kiloniellaceae bacterium]
MEALLYLIPAALFLGLLGLGAFLWALRSGQFEDLDGAANRILFDEEPLDAPTGKTPAPKDSGKPPAEETSVKPQ